VGLSVSPADLPALLMVPDLLPGGGPLNGRRWAGQQLLQLWLELAQGRELPLLLADPAFAGQVQDLISSWGSSSSCRSIGFSSASELSSCGGLLVPDPSIGLWSLWRDAYAAPASFSLIGQIHTLCTTGAMVRLEELTSENVFSWDCLICSSTAGREVVQSVLTQREDRQSRRAGVSAKSLRQHRPQLPVIPLPIPVKEIQSVLPERSAARAALGLPRDADVVLWLGRLTLLSKSDQAPTYSMLDCLARQRQRPLVLLELGPDDNPEGGAALKRLRSCFRHLQFRRLGDEKPVTEGVKYQAFAASDIGISLVDNVQETFGQSVVEMMAAGLPVVLSDWDGYRDLVQDGCHGFRVPSRWAEVSSSLSVNLGWNHRVGLDPYPAVAGALAQMVQLDLAAARDCISTLLKHVHLRKSMGAAAARWAREQFDRSVVAERYQQLFVELGELRAHALEEWHQPSVPPLAIDPVHCFQPFASPSNGQAFVNELAEVDPSLRQSLEEQRLPLWKMLASHLGQDQQILLRQALEQKHGMRLFDR